MRALDVRGVRLRALGSADLVVVPPAQPFLRSLETAAAAGLPAGDCGVVLREHDCEALPPAPAPNGALVARAVRAAYVESFGDYADVLAAMACADDRTRLGDVDELQRIIERIRDTRADPSDLAIATAAE